MSKRCAWCGKKDFMKELKKHHWSVADCQVVVHRSPDGLQETEVSEDFYPESAIEDILDKTFVQNPFKKSVVSERCKFGKECYDEDCYNCIEFKEERCVP